MDIESHKEFIKRSYEEYKKIGYVECPAFADEKVYFRKRGFEHLIKKKEKYRHVKDQLRRLKLLANVVDILQTVSNVDSYRIIDEHIHFWSLKGKNNFKEIIVIVCQIKDGHKHFISVMDKKST